MAKGSYKGNVDPKIKTNRKALEEIPSGSSEHSEGVIPPAMLRKHGLETKIPAPMGGDPKKQANLPDDYESDVEP